MRKNKILSLLLVVLIICNSVIGLFVINTFALNSYSYKGVDGLKLIEGYDDSANGDDITNSKLSFRSINTISAAVSDKTNGNGMAMKVMSSSNLNNRNFGVSLPASALSEADGVIMYLKTPNSVYAENSILISPSLSGKGGYVLKDNAQISLLRTGETKWSEQTSSKYMFLESGFEGYVKFDFSQFKKNWGNTIDNDMKKSLSVLNEFEIYLGTLGGEDNAFFIDDIIIYNGNYNGSIDFVSEKFKALMPEQKPPMKLDKGLSLIDDFEGYKKNSILLGGRFAFVSGKGATAVASDEFCGNGNLAGKVYATEVQKSKNLMIKLPKGSLKDQKGIITYIKVPETQGGANFLLFVLSVIDKGGYTVKSGAKMKVLTPGSTEWVTKDAAREITFESGFEGYISIGFDQFEKNWGDSVSSDLNETIDEINGIEIYVGSMGGVTEGGGYNALYFDDILTFDETYADTTEFLPADFGTRTGISGLEYVENFEDCYEMQNLVGGKLIFSNLSSNNAVAANMSNGKIAACLKSDKNLSGTNFMLALADKVLADAKGIVFYVKMPKSQNKENFLLLAPTVKDVGGYVLKDGSKVKLLERASDTWEEIECGNTIPLKSGFEGYVCISISDLRKNWGAVNEDIAQSVEDINAVEFYVETFNSGESLYLDDIMIYTDSYSFSTNFVTSNFKNNKYDNLYLINDFENYKKADSLIPSEVSFALGGTGTAVTDDTHKGSGELSAKFYSVDMKSNGNSLLRFQPGIFENKDGIIFYLKSPNGILGSNGITPVITIMDKCGYVLRTNAKVEVIESGSKEWKTYSSWSEMQVLNGFEGYVKLDFDQFEKHWGTGFEDLELAAASVNAMEIYVDVMGGILKEQENAMYIDDIYTYSSKYDGGTDFLPADWLQRTATRFSINEQEDDDSGEDDWNTDFDIGASYWDTDFPIFDRVIFSFADDDYNYGNDYDYGDDFFVDFSEPETTIPDTSDKSFGLLNLFYVLWLLSVLSIGTLCYFRKGKVEV